MPWLTKDEYRRLMAEAAVGKFAGETVRRLEARIHQLEDEARRAHERTDREQLRADSAMHAMVYKATGLDVPTPGIVPSEPDRDPFTEEDPDVVQDIRDAIERRGLITVLEEARA